MSTSSSQPPCPVCRQPLALRTARGRKSGKTFLMLLCAHDPRHFRGFINDRSYVDGVLSRLEDRAPLKETEVDANDNPATSGRSKTNLERGG